MNTTSLELCKELYEVSGWTTGHVHHDVAEIDDNGKIVKHHWGIFSERTIVISLKSPPAYSIDYLLDKLTEVKTGLTLYHVHSTMVWECFYAGKFFDYGIDSQHWETQDYNPANAACKLAIELFKSGVLKKGSER